MALRRELCDEAIRLAGILTEHPVGRMGAREDTAGGLLLLEEQGRELWDQNGIEQGLRWLAKSAAGESFSRYHAEAGIAAEHCLAPSFQETRWDRVAESYLLLERSTESPIHKLNRAVAVAEWKGPAEGLAVLKGFEPPTWLAGTYLWPAVMADLHRRCGNSDAATRYRDAALKSAPTLAVRQLVHRRLGAA